MEEVEDTTKAFTQGSLFESFWFPLHNFRNAA
jgi:hypothetical protein